MAWRGGVWGGGWGGVVVGEWRRGVVGGGVEVIVCVGEKSRDVE